MKYIHTLKTATLLACCLLAGCAGARTSGGGCPPGMRAYWTFDEGAGPDPDRSSLYGSAGFAKGVSGTCLEMSHDGYAIFNRVEALQDLRQVTVETWFKYRSLSRTDQGGRLFCRGGSFCLLVGAPGSGSSALGVYLAGTDSEDWRRGRTMVAPGEWHHAAFTFDGRDIRIYLDGRLDGLFPTNGSMVIRPDDQGCIGRYPYAAPGYQAPLDGFVDELAVYDRPLTPDEIAAHYRLGRAGKGYCGG